MPLVETERSSLAIAGVKDKSWRVQRPGFALDLSQQPIGDIATSPLGDDVHPFDLKVVPQSPQRDVPYSVIAIDDQRGEDDRRGIDLNAAVAILRDRVVGIQPADLAGHRVAKTDGILVIPCDSRDVTGQPTTTSTRWNSLRSL